MPTLDEQYRNRPAGRAVIADDDGALRKPDGSTVSISGTGGGSGMTPTQQAKLDSLPTGAELAAAQQAQDLAIAGKASLIGGKLDPAQVPDIALQQYLGAVANDAEMLALAGQPGDWCTRSDTGTDWRVIGNPASLAGWLQTSYPSAPVSSVNGKTGAVTLAKADVGLGNVDNTPDSAKPVSTAQAAAIAAKMDASMPALQAVFDGGSTAQKAAFQYSVSGAALGNTCAVIGDSRMASGYTATQSLQTGHMPCLAARLGSRLLVVVVFAVGGKRLDQVLTEQIPQVLAMSPRPAYVYMECGYNDFNQGATLAQVIQRWTDIYTALFSAGIKLIGNTSLPGSSLPAYGATAIQQYNQYLLDQNAKRRGVYYWDAVPAIVDTATGMFVADCTYDGIHCNSKGAWKVAARGAKLLEDQLNGFDTAALASNTTQLMGNPMGAGSSGTAGTAITGQVPTVWEAGCNGGGAATLSKVPGPLGRASTSTRVAITSAPANAYTYIEPGRCYFMKWVSGGTATAGYRLRPPTKNGVHYLCITGGALAATADPTATWSTTLGDRITSGTAVFAVVAGFTETSKVVFCADVTQTFTGSNSCAMQIIKYTGSAFVYFEAMLKDPTASPTDAGGDLLIQSSPIAAANFDDAVFIICRLFIYGDAGSTVDVHAIYARLI